jgi:hypothetical protein
VTEPRIIEPEAVIPPGDPLFPGMPVFDLDPDVEALGPIAPDFAALVIIPEAVTWP